MLVETIDGAFDRLRKPAGALGRVIALGAALAVAASPGLAAQGAFPNRPVTVVIGSSAGSTMELEARILGDRFRRLTGQPLEIDLRPGAGGAIAATYVMKSPPDGYELFLSPATAMVFAPLTHKHLTYDPSKLTPIVEIGAQPLALVTRGDFPGDSLKSLVAYAKAHPGKTYFSSTGIGGGNHMSALLLEKYSGVRMTHVPYEGEGPAMQAVLRGEVDFAILSLSSVLPWYKEGKVKLLAVGSSQRSPDAPKVPTFRELGYPQQFILTAWTVLVGPPDMPTAIVDALNKTVNQEYQTPEVKAAFKKLRVDPVGGSPAAVASMLRSQAATWRQVARENGILPK